MLLCICHPHTIVEKGEEISSFSQFIVAQKLHNQPKATQLIHVHIGFLAYMIHSAVLPSQQICTEHLHLLCVRHNSRP